MEFNEILKNPLFEMYYESLAEWNQKFNLTAVIEKNEVYLKHFYDSALPSCLIPEGSALLDVGSGAGFPGIPLKIIKPSLDVTLIDSVGKKVDFLNHVIGRLGLTGITATHIRAEDLSRRSFDVVTARAVASLNILIEYGLPFLKVGGFLLAYKAVNLDAELESCKNALTVLGGQIEDVIKRELCAETVRSFVIVRKVKECPPNYPRKGNKPRLSPL